jgi:HEAT repeat protein
LRRALEDPSHCVRIAAAEALCEIGAETPALAALAQALAVPDACVQLQAVSALWHLGEKARPAVPALKKALATKTEPEFQRTYFEWAAKKTIERLAG